MGIDWGAAVQLLVGLGAGGILLRVADGIIVRRSRAVADDVTLSGRISDELDRTLTRHARQLEALEMRNAALEASLAALEAKHRADIEAKDAQIDKLEAQMRALATKHNADILARDNRIAELEREKAWLMRDLASMEQRLEKLEGRAKA